LSLFLKKNGVPDDFKYLAVIESGLVNVVSNAVLEEFGNLCLKLNGLEVNNNIDERYNRKINASSLRFYFKSKAKFGSWTLAAASYNRGWLRLMEFQN
jgi:hypothetical protein